MSIDERRDIVKNEGPTSITLAVVIPIGPRCRAEFIADTIDSIETLTTEDRRILLADDSGTGTGAKLQAAHPELEVITTSKNLGTFGGLYLNLSAAFSWMLQRYRFRALLRIDTDALVIGPEPEADAIACFDDDQLLGCVGNYTHDFGGGLRDRTWVAEQLRKQTTSFRSLVRRPVSGRALRRVLPRAIANGYLPGEDVFGGACFYSYNGLNSLRAAGYLPHRALARAYLQEDEIFTLVLRACGYHFRDMWIYNESFGCAWNTLPASPEELLASNAKVIHSVRKYHEWSEAQIRDFFRPQRQLPVPNDVAEPEEQPEP